MINFFSKFFKNRQFSEKSSEECLNIVINTDKDLSEGDDVFIIFLI